MEKDRRRLIAGGVSLLEAFGATRVLAAATAVATGEPSTAGEAPSAACAPLLAHSVRPLGGGAETPLCSRFSNEVLLIVNTASRCGFTPQLEALETLHQRYSDRGLAVLGFPSDDFRQELADEDEIAEFCRLNYGVSFPMFGKVHVAGEHVHPLYRDLAAATGGAPTWNFNKYLVDRSGRALARYDASTQPLGDRLLGDIDAVL